METTTPEERLRSRALAQKYRSEGYEVIVEPEPEQLPDFLVGYRPTLLLRKAGESVVVQVQSRWSLGRDPQIRDLTELLRDRPGWRLELFLTEVQEPIEAPLDSVPFTREDVLRSAKVAERLLEAGFAEAALMQAWAAAEASVRMNLMMEEEMPTPMPESVYVVKRAVMLGAITREDYLFLYETLKVCNAIAHGFTPPDFDVSCVGKLISTAKRLLPIPLLPANPWQHCRIHHPQETVNDHQY
jgi:hypothetical protein